MISESTLEIQVSITLLFSDSFVLDSFSMPSLRCTVLVTRHSVHLCVIGIQASLASNVL